ncbi:hypothetical protein OEB99_08840 [Actinotalea sp. M2MS4P-6]|uniref:hypothetical protein n=1 Tax=Actinotalea sp. M2MS4P-6 TaxID=2983762 RepID=UPI0021E3F523|nr:hypothetical protein [Actinotalea sp. M2MS4P-6]MCV2394415.1 hypothetical protein [Actinotalea sp. M2MS4P-6]
MSDVSTDRSNRRGPAARPAQSGRAERRVAVERGLGLFSRMALTGLVVGLLSLPVLTALPAAAAGANHLRRHVEGREDGTRELLRGFRAAVRDLWWVGLAATALLALLTLDALLALGGSLPGGRPVLVISVALAAAVLVVGLRVAGAWRPGLSGVAAVRTGARRAGGDVSGDLLVVVAAGVCAGLVWMLPVMVVLVPGLLALALTSVERRAARAAA